MTAMAPTVDAVVIGAGLAGAAAAFALATGPGLRVLVLEREAIPGVHASGRNAAMVRRLVVEDSLGSLAREGAAFIEAGCAGLALRPAYRRSGGLVVGTAERLAALAGAAAAARAAGVEVVDLDWAGLRARFPVLARSSAAGGLLVPADGVVDVAALLGGYLDAARRAGAEVAFDEPVAAIEVEAGRVSAVRTAKRTVLTRTVVDAAGPWAGEVAALAGAAPIPIRPLRRHLYFALAAPVAQVALTAPAQPDADAALVAASAAAGAAARLPVPSSPPLFALQRAALLEAGARAGASARVRAGEAALEALGLGAFAPWIWDETAGYYVRPEAGGLLLCACDESEMPPGIPATDPAVDEILAEKLAREAPALAELPIAARWAGLRSFAPDRLPVIGWDPLVRGFCWAAALGGHGVTVSAAAGRLAAAWIAGGPLPAHAAAFDPARFATSGAARFATSGAAAPGTISGTPRSGTPPPGGQP